MRSHGRRIAIPLCAVTKCLAKKEQERLPGPAIRSSWTSLAVGFSGASEPPQQAPPSNAEHSYAIPPALGPPARAFPQMPPSRRPGAPNPGRARDSAGSQTGNASTSAQLGFSGKIGLGLGQNCRTGKPAHLKEANSSPFLTCFCSWGRVCRAWHGRC